jgi:hypothetical protein
VGLVFVEDKAGDPRWPSDGKRTSAAEIKDQLLVSMIKVHELDLISRVADRKFSEFVVFVLNHKSEGYGFKKIVPEILAFEAVYFNLFTVDVFIASLNRNGGVHPKDKPNERVKSRVILFPMDSVAAKLDIVVNKEVIEMVIREDEWQLVR